MFEDLYDAVSFLWSWKWPRTRGEITEVLVERVNPNQRSERYRLSITYQFFVSSDGPYTGEDFWNPAFATKKRVIAARRKFHVGQPVDVRYRPDDPSVNRLDRQCWKPL
jgi:hypothetical protein